MVCAVGHATGFNVHTANKQASMPGNRVWSEPQGRGYPSV